MKFTCVVTVLMAVLISIVNAEDTDSIAGATVADTEPALAKERGPTAPAASEAARNRGVVVREILSPDMFTYSDAKENLYPADLPLLYQILNEIESYQSWGNAATAIGFLGESEESYVAITDYVQRPQRFADLEDYDQMHQAVLSNLLMAKISALHWLPFLNDLEGTKALRNILTDAGAAQSFLEHWKVDEIPVGFGDIRRAAMQLRVAAAAGLIFHDQQGNTELVRRQLVLVNKQFKGIPDPAEVQVAEDDMLQNGYMAMFQSSLAHALVVAEYIEQHGTEEYLAASGSYPLEEKIKYRFEEIVEEYGLYD